MSSVTFYGQIIDFNKMSPLDQRQYLFELEKKAGSCLSRLRYSPFNIFQKHAVKAEEQRQYFLAYQDAMQVFKRRYEVLQSGRIEMPLEEAAENLQIIESFKQVFWNKQFCRQDQIQFLEKLCNNIDIFSVPLFKIFFQTVTKDIGWGTYQEIFIIIFIINEIAAKYKLPQDVETQVRDFLQYFVDKSKTHMPVTLAKEGLELLNGRNYRQPDKRSAFKSRLSAAKITCVGLSILLFCCFVYFVNSFKSF